MIDYSCCGTTFSRLYFFVHLRRKSLYYVINFVVPCAMFSFMSIVSFILQPSNGDRIGLGM